MKKNQKKVDKEIKNFEKLLEMDCQEINQVKLKPNIS